MPRAVWTPARSEIPWMNQGLYTGMIVYTLSKAFVYSLQGNHGPNLP